MPFSLQGELTGDTFADSIANGCQFEPDKGTVQIVFAVLNADVIARFYKLVPGGPQPIWDGIERRYPAGTGDSLGANVAGIDFRSADAGSPASVLGTQSFHGDILSAVPLFGGGQIAPQPAAEPSDVISGETAGTTASITPIAASTPCFSVVVKAHPTNADTIFVGGSTLLANGSNGYSLVQDDAVAFDIPNLDLVFIAVLHTGDKADWLALV